MADSQRKTANLFDIDNVLEDYYLRNGVPTEYHIGGYVLSDYIPIASDTATISAKCAVISDSGAHWAVYDENKTFIRGGIAFTARYEPYSKVLDTSGAAFIRVDYATDSLTDCMLNIGSTALPYEPYWPHSLKKFDGTNWIDAAVKEWDGSQWN